MPLYLLDMDVTGEPDGGERARTSRRFPEIVVEHRFVEHDRTGHEVWVFRAPSAAHVERWASATCSALRSLKQIEESSASATTARGHHEGGSPRREEASS